MTPFLRSEETKIQNISNNLREFDDFKPNGLLPSPGFALHRTAGSPGEWSPRCPLFSMCTHFLRKAGQSRRPTSPTCDESVHRAQKRGGETSTHTDAGKRATLSGVESLRCLKGKGAGPRVEGTLSSPHVDLEDR